MQIIDIRKVNKDVKRGLSVRITVELTDREAIELATWLAAFTDPDKVNELARTLRTDREPID